MKYRIGLDLGTTATKACAFNLDGEMVGMVERGYELLHPAADAAVQRWPDVLAAAEAALQQLVATTSGEPISVGLSCAMHSLILADDQYQPLSDIITWADLRAQVAMDTFTSSERKELLGLTGTPVHPMSPLVKMCWLAKKQDDTWQQAAWSYDLKGLLTQSWTTAGPLIDEQLASATGLMDLEHSAWSDRALSFVPGRMPQLPAIHPANTQLEWQPEVAEKLGLVGVPLYLGGSDGVLANLGSGILEPGDVALSIGTSGALRTTHSQARIDPAYGLFNYKMKAGLYAIGGPTNNGGKVLEYWQQLLSGHFPDMASFLAGAFSVEPETTPGFQPWLYGERAPIWDAAATAALTQLSGHHTPAHIARAVLEGVTGNIVEILHQLEAAVGPANRILASGGFTKSPEWVKLVAARTGREVVVAEAAQASAYGAALVGTM